MGTGPPGPASEDARTGLTPDFNLPWPPPNPSPVPLEHPVLLTCLGHRISEFEGRESKRPLGLHRLQSFSTKQMGTLSPRQSSGLPKVTQYEQRCGLPALSGCPGLPHGLGRERE